MNANYQANKTHRDPESMQGQRRAKVNVTLTDKAPFQTIW